VNFTEPVARIACDELLKI